jgi:hypothetical protein
LSLREYCEEMDKITCERKIVEEGRFVFQPPRKVKVVASKQRNENMALEDLDIVDYSY